MLLFDSFVEYIYVVGCVIKALFLYFLLKKKFHYEKREALLRAALRNFIYSCKNAHN